MGTEVLETFASEPIPRTVCEGSLVPGCPHLGAPQVFAPSHCQGRPIMTTMLTKPRSHPLTGHRNLTGTAATGGGARLRRGRQAMERDGARCLREERAPWTGSRAPPGPVRIKEPARIRPQCRLSLQILKSCHRTLDQLLSHPIILTDRVKLGLN